jgi:hypothetical protein
MADNTLSGLVVTIYDALNTVAREQIGFIPATRKWNFPGRKVAKNEPITFPIVPAFAAPTDISASNVISDPSGIVVGSDTMYMDSVKSISWGWNGEEAVGLGNSQIFATTQADAFKQAFRSFANKIESDLAANYLYASRAYGTSGTTPFGTVDNLTDLSETRRILEDNGMWMTGKMKLVCNNAALSNLRGKQTVVFKANEAGRLDGQTMGTVTQLEGFNIHQSGQIATHVSGYRLGASSTGSSVVGTTAITIDSAGSGTIYNGDVLSFAGNNNKYVMDSSTSATAIVLAAPGIVEATVGAVAITDSSTYKANMAFNEDAMVLISALPNLPEGGDQAVSRMTVQDPISGLLFEVSEYKGYRKVIYVVASAWGTKVVKTEGLALLLG